MRSFYIVLSSKQSKQQAPSSTASDFVTLLKTPLKLYENAFEVGLAEVTFQSSEKIFPNPGDNVLVCEVGGKEVIKIQFEKTNNDILVDIFQFNQACKESNYPVLISQRNLNGKQRFEVYQRFGSLTGFEFDESFAKVFGYNRTTYFGEQVIAEAEYNEIEYINLPKGTKLEIQIIKYPQKQTITIEEPHEFSCEGLITELNTSLVNNQIHVIHFTNDIKGDDDYIKLEGEDKSAVLFPSKRIQQILDINTNTGIGLGFESGVVNLYRGIERIIFTSDLIAPQILFDSASNVLRILANNRKIKGEQTFTFNPVFYSPLTKSIIDSIHIQAINEAGSFVAFKGDIILVLHVRPRSI